MKFKSVIGGAVAAALFMSSAFAADTAPLPAGKPASVKKAAFVGTTTDLLLTLGVAAFLITLAAGGISSTTTGTSS